MLIIFVVVSFHLSCFSMAKSEDVQYFQFDQEGNMYIFEGGAGCTGKARKVAPGEDLHLGSWNEVNVTDPPSQELSLTDVCLTQSDSLDSCQMECSSMTRSQSKKYG